MIKGYKYVEIKGAMKQTHRRVEFSSDAPIKLGSVVEFMYETEAPKVQFHVINETEVKDEQEFMIDVENIDGAYTLQTSLTYKGRHQLTPVEFDQDDKETKRGETFYINVK